jgi:hypothetical protein
VGGLPLEWIHVGTTTTVVANNSHSTDSSVGSELSCKAVNVRTLLLLKCLADALPYAKVCYAKGFRVLEGLDPIKGNKPVYGAHLSNNWLPLRCLPTFESTNGHGIPSRCEGPRRRPVVLRTVFVPVSSQAKRRASCSKSIELASRSSFKVDFPL